MPTRPTVRELIVTVALRVAVPIEYGEELSDGLDTVLGEIEDVRHVALEELGDVERDNDQLHVETYARLTFHFDPEAIDDPEHVARDHLITANALASVRNFQIASGPYLIESW